MKRSLACFAIIVALGSACTTKSPEELLASAQEYSRQGNHNAAMIQVRNALRQRPEDGALRLYLGQTLLLLNDPGSAQREFRKALQYGQTLESVLPLLARAMVDHGETAALIEEFGTTALPSASAHAQLKAAVGQAYLRLERTSDAAAAFNAAVKANADYLPARIGLVRVLATDARLKQAARGADELLAAHPASPEVHVLVAELLALAGDRAGAIAALQQAVQKDPKHAASRYALVEALVGEQQYDAAAEQLAELRKLGKGDLRISYFDGAIAFGRDDLIKARESLQWVLKFAPDSVAALILSAAIELQAGRPFHAESLLRQAVALQPQNVSARWLLVRACVVSDQPEKALEAVLPLLTAQELSRANLDIEVVTQLAATEPQFMPTLMYLGERALKTADLKSAMTLYKVVVDFDPDNVVALNNLAWAAGRLRDSGAVDYAERAVRVAPNNAAALDTLGELLVNKGDVVRGAEQLRKATALAPDRPDIRLNYAKALIKAGKKNIARAELKTLQSAPADFAGKTEVEALLKEL